MREEGLRDYYEQELRYLRELGKEFAEQHGEVAEGLKMESGQWADPHVERLLEGFAFLAARIHRRMDEDFSEVCQTLLNVIYPQYLRPIPSMSIVQMEVDPDQGHTSGLTVEAGQSLVSPPTKGSGVRCRFRTSYPVTLWPVSVGDARWRSPHSLDLGRREKEVAAALSLTLQTHGGFRFPELEMDRIRLFLDGDLSLTTTVFELLDNNCHEILIRDPKNPQRPPLVLSGSSLVPVGMGEDEGILPLSRQAFLGYRIIQEYFAFPHKFLFFDLTGLEALTGGEFGTEVEILFLLRPFAKPDRQEALERGVTKDTIRLGCTPIVNLFTTESEPIRVHQRRTDYLVRAKGSTKEFSPEVFSIDRMEAVVGGTPKRVPLEPFFSYRNRESSGTAPVFWHFRRFPSNWLADGATDISVSFVDPGGDTIRPTFPSVSASLTCFNGTLPTKLPIGTAGDFHAEEGEGSALKRIVSLMHATPPIQPPLGSSTFWRIVSQFSLNYLSLTDDGGDALRELLRLYNFGDQEIGEKHIRGISRVEREPWHARVRGEHGLSFARGQKVTIEFDDALYPGGGVYLLASVLEQFLGLYSSMNSFSKLVARVRSKQKTYTLREWHPRAGQKPLL